MNRDDILLLKGDEVRGLLAGRELQVSEVVRDAYVAYDAGSCYLPHSSFVYFPDRPGCRIISLGAYLDDGSPMAGVKWISSFPANLDAGMQRASAVLILNSVETGRAIAVMEGSVVSAARTAASASVATMHLHGADDSTSVGLIGCGPINYEIVRYLRASFPSLRRLHLRDTDAARAASFKTRFESEFPGLSARVASSAEEVFEATDLVSIATTAQAPYIDRMPRCQSHSTILHMSVRDLSPEIILSCDNVVDDVDHACRERTSLQLAEEISGSRDFIRCTLADVLLGRASAFSADESRTVFTPFGLGILDIAVGRFVYESALRETVGEVVSGFFPSV